MAGSLAASETVALIAVTAALTVYSAACLSFAKRLPAACYLRYVGFLFVCFTIAEIAGFPAAVWLLALLCFWALREYFSLADIRLQDRLGLLGGYLSIPFMIYFIQIDWYGMFIVSIPVYAFLAIPLLVTLGGRERKGTVFSVGAIDFGLFLFVYCVGHIGYLMRYSTWMAAGLVLTVALSDGVAFLASRRVGRAALREPVGFLAAVPFTVGLNLLLAAWSGIPTGHAVILGVLVPGLAAMGRHTIDYVKEDLGIGPSDPFPDRGEILDHLRSLFFVAPVVFHYIRYYLR
jgi:phosphatidate cytidylyltransferase